MSSSKKRTVKEIKMALDGDAIEDDEVWGVVKSFVRENGMVAAQIRSFNNFIYKRAHEIVDLFKHVVIEEKTKAGPKRYILELSDLIFTNPTFTEKDDSTHDLYPVEALQRNITYSSAMYIDVTVVTPTGETTFYEKNFLGNMPVMVRSDLCHVSEITNDPEELARQCEDFYDNGGYFVISPKSEGTVAQRRILVPQERSAPNKVYIFSNRKNHPKYKTYAEVRSLGSNVHTTTTTVGFLPSAYTVGRISVVLPWIDATEIPLGVIFNALGVISTEEIFTYIVGPPDDAGVGGTWTDEDKKEIIRLIIPTLEYSFEIQDQESALFFIGKKGRKFIKEGAETEDDFDPNFLGDDSDDDAEAAAEIAAAEEGEINKEKSSAISYAKHLLGSELFAHVATHLPIEDRYKEKAKYLGYVVYKLVQVLLGKKQPESRDHYKNKRVLTTGELITQQFYGGLRRLVMEITKNTRKALRNGNTVNISSWIKPTIMTNAMQGAISGNNWSTGGAASKGISQVYEQFNYASSIANARKNTVPIAAEGGKVIEPRDLHGSHFGLICVTGDTLVLLADGNTLCRIDELEGKAVMTVNPTTLKSEPSGIYNFFKMMPKKLLEISDDCGRKIKCTPDHPFLVRRDNENVWVSAGDLKKGDSVFTVNTYKFDIPNNIVKLPLKNLDSEIAIIWRQKGAREEHVGILASLAGSLFTDGHISRKGTDSYQCEFYLGELEDALSLQEDLYKLGFGSSYIGRKHTLYKGENQTVNYATWVVTKGGEFSKIMVQLGCPVGKKGDQILKTPKWISKGSPYIQKQWLSGFQGGDGCKLSFVKNQKTMKVSLNDTLIKNSKEETKDFFEDMVRMYKSFGIESKVQTKGLNYILSFSGDRQNLLNYAKFIDYKYCAHKKRESAIVVNFLMHWKVKFEKQKNIYKNIIDSDKYDEKLGVTKNKYYKIRNKPDTTPKPSIDIEKFKERSYQHGKCISFISKIKEVEPEYVYDFTTISENHSFISNEFVTHQCPAETPEGKKAGLVKNFAFMSLVTTGTDFEPVRLLLGKILGDSAEKHYPMSLLWTKVFLNGVPVGHTKKPKKFTSTIKSYRRTGKVTSELSIAYLIEYNEIHICIDAGRLCRPLFVVDSQQGLLFNIDHLEQLEVGDMSWTELLASGTVELIDKMEEETCFIIGFPSELENMSEKDRKEVTHCEIHPSLMYGIGGSIIPFSNHNQSPRNCYQCIWKEEPVLMGDGTWKKIKDIKIGDEVLSFCPETMRTKTTKVVNHFVRPTKKKILKIETITGRKIKVTEDHKMMTSEGWMEAKDIIPGETKVAILNGIVIFIDILSISEEKNVEIADITTKSKNHSFIAGDGFCVHNSSMGKQAIGVPFSNYKELMCGTFHTLMYLHRPLALTRSASIIRFDELPAGQNAIVAIMPRPFNEEDSIEMNQDSIDRGFMVSFKWTCMYADIREENLESFGIPNEEMGRFKGNPRHLTKEGYAKPGSKIEKGDIVIGKIAENRGKYVSHSQVYDHKWPSIVDKVMTGTTGDGYPFIRVMLCQRREPVVGDKFSFMHGQKGTIGMKPRSIDLPFNKDGIVPDIVMNSLALPSRMTIAMLIEAWTGKVVVSSSKLHNMKVGEMVKCKGDDPEKDRSSGPSQKFRDMFCHPHDPTLVDATPFRKFDVEVIREEMAKYGMEYGDEYLTDGVTGEKLRAFVFFAPAHSQRLKHMVVDKIHGRARGGRTTLMRQPHEGRAAGGGLRFGVMERDCILGQGASKFARDRLIICSDDFKQYICTICGIAVGDPEDGCKICKSNKVVLATIPYGTKIVNQEMMALNIVSRTFVDTKKF